MKITLAPFGGLVVTVADASVGPLLVQAMLALLQYDKTPIADCYAIRGVEDACDSETPQRCIMADALCAQVLGSMGYPYDTTFLEQALTQVDLYEPWELDHVKAVLQFYHDKNFAATVLGCLSALHKEHRDVFSLRLLFISGVLGAQYGAMWQGCLHVVAQYCKAVLPKDGTVWTWHEAVTRQLFDTSSFDANIAAGGTAFEGPHHVRQELLPSVLHDTAIPYAMTYYAFALEELIMDPSTWRFQTMHHSALTEAIPLDVNLGLRSIPNDAVGLQQAEVWNLSAMRLVMLWNQSPDQTSQVWSYGALSHPFGMHTLCHIYEARRDPLSGLAAAQDVPEGLWVPTQHLVVHCWWHMALFLLDLGRFEASLKLFEERVLPAAVKEDPFGLCDVTAYVARTLFAAETEEALGQTEATVAALRQGLAARVEASEALWHFHHGVSPDGTLSTDAAGVYQSRITALQKCPFFYIHTLVSRFLDAHVAGAPVVLPPVLPMTRRFTNSGVEATEGEHPLPLATVNHMVRGSLGSATNVESLASLWEGRLEAWVEMGGSAAQRDLLMRLSLHQIAALIRDENTSSHALIRSAASVVASITEMYPLQPYYAKLHAVFASKLPSSSISGVV